MFRMRRIYFEIAAVLCALGTLAFMGRQLVGAHDWLLGNGMPVYGDFMAFWSAGHMALQGHVDKVYDAFSIMAAHRDAIPEHRPYFPWRSPPVFLLIMMPLAALPYWASGFVFLIGCLTAFVIALAPFMPDRRAWIIQLSTPSLLFHLGSAQVTPLIVALHAFAFRWLDKRPVAAGGAIALLAIKPHLAVLWPVLLVCQQRWRTFLAAGAFTLALVVVTGMIFGFDLYPLWFDDLHETQDLLKHLGLPPNTVASLYGNLVYLRVNSDIAMAAHLASAAAAIGVCIYIFLQNDAKTSMAALPAGTLLISPYLFFYDSLALSISVLALLRMPVKGGEMAIYSFAFIAGGAMLGIGFWYYPPICPAADWSVLLLALVRTRELVKARAAPRPAESVAALPA